MSQQEPKQPQDEEREERAIRETLKRCSAETIETAVLFKKTRNPGLANAIVIGILARFLEPEQRAKIKLTGESDHLRLMEDLGVDSLTMVEVVMLVEEVLGISIKNEELRDLRTIGDIKAYVNAITHGKPPPERAIQLGIAEIVEIMPQQPPFLFLQSAELRSSEIRGVYKISGDEFFLEGHFKGRPVFPASLQLEALGQLGVLYLLKGKHQDIAYSVDATKIYFTSCGNVRCQHACLPGETLALTLAPVRIKHPLAIFEGSIVVGGRKVAFVEEIGLTFDYLPVSIAGKTGVAATKGATGVAPSVDGNT